VVHEGEHLSRISCQGEAKGDAEGLCSAGRGSGARRVLLWLADEGSTVVEILRLVRPTAPPMTEPHG